MEQVPILEQSRFMNQIFKGHKMTFLPAESVSIGKQNSNEYPQRILAGVELFL